MTGKNPISVLALNCTLNKSPERSHTGALLEKVMDLFEQWGAVTEIVRVVDYNVPFGVESDLGDGDEWPQILTKMKAADVIIMGMPLSLIHI